MAATDCEFTIQFGDTDTVTHSGTGTDDDPIIVTVPTAECSIVGPDGQTGMPSGRFVDACATLDLRGEEPETAGYDPTRYPTFWRQPFTNGVTGSEVWTVVAGPDGQHQWEEI